MNLPQIKPYRQYHLNKMSFWDVKQQKHWNSACNWCLQCRGTLSHWLFGIVWGPHDVESRISCQESQDKQQTDILHVVSTSAELQTSDPNLTPLAVKTLTPTLKWYSWKRVFDKQFLTHLGFRIKFKKWCVMASLIARRMSRRIKTPSFCYKLHSAG